MHRSYYMGNDLDAGLSGWKEDLASAVPVLPSQRDAILKAYHLAVTVGGLIPGDDAGIAGYISANASGTGGPAIVKSFLAKFSAMARSGAIPYSEYDPSKSLLSQISSGAGKVASAAFTVQRNILIFGALALGGYILFTANKFIPARRRK